MSTSFVDFKVLKESVSIERLLDHYGLLETLSGRGKELTGKCPFCKPGKSKPFKVSLVKNVWHCFKCDRGGDVIAFVIEREGVPLLEAAQLLADWFGIDAGSAPPTNTRAPAPPDKEQIPVEEKPREETRPNSPLTWSYKDLSLDHSFFSSHQLSREILEYFGVGYYAGSGMMKSRVVVPVHDVAGRVIAWLGYATHANQKPYPLKLPERSHFLPELAVFNLNRILERQAQVSRLLVVRDPLDVIKQHQVGVQNVVATIARGISEAQAKLIRYVLAELGSSRALVTFVSRPDDRTLLEEVAPALGHFRIRFDKF